MSSTTETTSGHSLALDPEAQQVIEERHAKRLSRLATHDHATLTISATLFLAVADALTLLVPSDHSPSLLTTDMLIALYAVTFRFEFEIATGLAVPTQLLLVPILFILPIGWVPLAVTTGIVLGSLTSYVRNELRLGRIFVQLVNTWHTVEPTLILRLTDEGEPSLSR